MTLPKKKKSTTNTRTSGGNQSILVELQQIIARTENHKKELQGIELLVKEKLRSREKTNE